jgi:cytochrome P450
LALATFPAIFAAVKANRSLIPKFVDETIRWICPVQHFMRTATSGYVLRGRNISKGDWIMLSYLSGNRDEQVFPEPFDFRLDRSPNPHVSFGHGAHICLGMHLAKMEIRIVLEELLSRLVAVEVTAEPKRSEALFAAGLKTLPIRFQLA